MITTPQYLGDFVEDASIEFAWNSFADGGASVTRSTDGTIYVEKIGAMAGADALVTKANPGVVTDTAHGLLDGDEVFFYGMTQFTGLNGTIQTVANKTADTFEIGDVSGLDGATETTGGSWVQVNSADVTDSEDYKGITGSHLVTIDGSADDYFAIGADYIVRLLTSTIDSVVVNVALAQFGIENRAMDIHLVNGSADAADSLEVAAARLGNKCIMTVTDEDNWSLDVKDFAGTSSLYTMAFVVSGTTETRTVTAV